MKKILISLILLVMASCLNAGYQGGLGGNTLSRVKSDAEIIGSLSIITAGTGQDPTTATWDIVGICSKQNQLFEVYNDSFGITPLTAYTNTISTITRIGTSTGIAWTAGVLSAPTNPGTKVEEWYIFPVRFEGPSFIVSMDVNSVDVNTAIMIGMVKDENEYNLYALDYNDTSGFLEWQSGGSGGAGGVYPQDITFTLPTPPYTLHFSCGNYMVYLAYEKNGVIQSIYEKDISFLGPDYRDRFVLQNYKLAIGRRTWGDAEAGNAFTITNIRAGYTAGMSAGSDMKPITYEDGSPIQINNKVYLTGTTHSSAAIQGLGGVNIYQMDIDTYSIDFVGKIFSLQATDADDYAGGAGRSVDANNIYGDGSGKVIYDRTAGKWRFFATRFGHNDTAKSYLYYGETTKNMLKGVHIIPTTKIDLYESDETTNSWDIDIIKTGGTWYMIYDTRTPSTHMRLVSNATNTLTSGWSLVGTHTTNGEGNCFFKMNGKYYISRTEAATGLKILNFTALTDAGNITTTKWPTSTGVSAPKSWGGIFSITDGTNTYFNLVIHVPQKWDSKTYAYGPLWIYKAREIENGLEFENKEMLQFGR